MAYKVINRFKDDDNTIYKVNDPYPKGNHKPTKKRIEELSDKHPKYKVAFIEEVKEENKKAPSKKADNKE